MKRTPSHSHTTVCIVDDDEAVRRALSRLVESMGIRAASFASPAELLSHDPDEEIGCLLLDVRLPGMDGFELHDRVVAQAGNIPVIFITAHADDTARARADRACAVAFLEKPFDDQSLYDAIQAALEGASPA